ncbi:MAG: hypothetical protein SH850_03735 [Planctomycetaceae bacterium]|nr:hypothetical protein [Planctomycetaceae bacterium]
MSITIAELAAEYLRSEVAPSPVMDWLTARQVLRAFARFVGPAIPLWSLERRDIEAFMRFTARRRSVCPAGEATARRIVTAVLRCAFVAGHFG